MSSLKEKSISGVLWNLMEKIGIRSVKLILGIVLARLLTPEDYGLIGMITVLYVVANVFIDSGFKLAFIQSRETNENQASTIFFFNLIVSITFYGIFWYSAPYIASFYEEPRLIDLIRVLSLVLIINSLGIMQLAKLTKEVSFKKKSIIVLVGALLSGLVGIFFALNGFGVWSLVYQGISSATFTTLGLWIFYHWRPKLVFRIRSLSPLFAYSSWALITDFFRTFFDNIYFLIIGKYFPAYELGYYTKANQFQGMLTKQFSIAISTVSFPVYSQLQNDMGKLKNAMRKFNQHSMFVIAPLAAIFIAIAEPLFLFLLTEKWVKMVPYFQLLLVAGVLYPIHASNVQVLGAQGRVKTNLKIEIIKNTLKISNILLMYRFGVIYIIYGEIVLSYLALIINTYYTKMYLEYGVVEQIKDVFGILLLSTLICLLGLFLNSSVENVFLQIILLPIFLALLYSLGMYVTNRDILNENLSIVRKRILRRRS